MKKKWYWVICALIPLAVGGLAAWITADGFEQYGELIRPPLSPPGIVFPIVWSVLYLTMGIASGLVISSGASPKPVMNAIRLYALQLAVNFLWPILFFSQGLYLISFFWLVLLLLLVLLLGFRFYSLQPLAGYLLIPYLIWLAFAGYLNLGVYLLN